MAYTPRRQEELLTSFNEECKLISEDCVKEGYTSHGSNYGLRCEALWNSSYAEEYEDAGRLYGTGN